ncbi:uncharacterized protein LOC127030386 [Gopherus flavomarginatus]|uniref:uncharacterized protein LOC127030386 n=1 Tax=Gopherus flavomarginatus TaxID=286002 RepID=UPI0021CC1168|nr:uncharacterized protein LOC127030386 [Gopherus flavomarginatus]
MAPLLLLLLAALPQPLGGSGRFAQPRLRRWGAAALRYLQGAPCAPRGGPEPECPALYVSEPARPGHKLRALFPDGSAAASDANRGGPGAPPAHDALLLLDPSPGASFGHPLRLFQLDFGVSRRRCRGPDRVYLGSYECLTLALRSRCENQTKRRGRGGQGTREAPPVGDCEIHFLPLVVAAQDPKRQQRLHCVELPGFSPCPQPLPVVSPGPAAAHCELDKNTRRCHRQQLPSHKSCRVYQTCDHAVLISGGWQDQITYPHHAHNLWLFAQMLRRNGFRQENIKAFFAGDGQAAVAAEVGDVYPATEKLLIRSHLALVCRTRHCADSLVLYLNSPTRSDGTMLLWDTNKNGIVSGALHGHPPAGTPGIPGVVRGSAARRCGVTPWLCVPLCCPQGGAERTSLPIDLQVEADPKERYPVAELLADLEGCSARRVFLFLDQSYPGLLAKKLLASGRHGNVVLVSGQRGSDFARGSAFSEFWARLQPDQCLLQHLLQAGPRAAGSSPGATLQLLNVTLAGAPCHNTPALTEDERRREFLGCQNLPTMLWYQAAHTQQQQDDD